MRNTEVAGFQLRLNRAVKERLTNEAQRNFRSLNNEINVRLIASLEKENARPVAAGQASDAVNP
ncbi:MULTISPECIES: Arc family DNA-binding protein [Paraburkholderia]|uniref:Arc-like DNA binding domain-containing protein n=1 Tax=Paraburkholderia tuberum TaxID=157910 RepID=A0A1H1GY98_9BURK|nr:MULTISPECIES: Arc family DNA-binding protein [Paraburkholderia]SDR18140.1 Arc-like DNA binding domain-containing protein [Paraburkholderia tuberum]